ncbi:MAG TPA: addiction module protein [Candidatus Thermoplasmatota archaeon]|nr:addiction module protein [Candidatus Thermoplasmatota archaeon]
MGYSTITLPEETKARLALVKGGRSWGEFMDDVLRHYPVEDAIQELESRLRDLRSGKVRGVPWSEIKKGLRRR